MANSQAITQPSPVRIRHIVRSDRADYSPSPGSPGVSPEVTILGKGFRGAWGGVNGDFGYKDGQYERRLGEEGDGAVVLPNVAGDDGTLHIDRFALLKQADYHPGDEWIEVWRGDGDLLNVWTPVSYDKRPSQMSLTGYDAFWTLRGTREFESGWWCHAPRDVFEHYTKVWRTLFGESLDRYDPAGATPITFVNDTTERQTDDDRLRYLKAGTTSLPGGVGNPDAGKVRLAPGGANGEAKLTVDPNYTVTAGLTGDTGHTFWRADIRFSRSALGTGTSIYVGLREFPFHGSDESITIRFTEANAFLYIVSLSAEQQLKIDTAPGGPYHVTIEGRDRWVYFFVDGRLRYVAPMPTGDVDLVPFVQMNQGAGDSSTARYADVESFLWRACEPYLMRDADKGDITLGFGENDLPTGGLQGEYFDDGDLRRYTNATDRTRFMLSPLRIPYARRLDKGLDFATNFMPVGVTGSDYWSARWTGAVYLPLADSEVHVAINFPAGQSRRRVWIGRTFAEDALIDSWTTGGATGRLSTGALRAVLGEVNGWYPIVIEYSQDTSNTSFQLQYSPDGSAWTTIPPTELSPYGVCKQHIRLESHYDVIRGLASSFGYQFTCEPRSLESGSFPGHMPPRLRCGRDTEKIIDLAEATSYAVRGTAAEIADILWGDGSGVADPTSSGQLSVEAANYDLLETRLFPKIEYVDVDDIDFEPLLAQRLDTLIGLYGTVWDEVGAVVAGHRDLLDSFPLTGDIAEFSWEPGDGVRFSLPDLGLFDLAPRQILGITRPHVPDGLRPPSVSVKRRPRKLPELIREIRRSMLRKSRVHQAVITSITGTMAAVNATEIPSNDARLPIPARWDSVIALHLVVNSMSPVGTAWAVNPTGSAGALTINQPGIYDLTPWYPAGLADRQDFSCTLSGGGADIVRYQLVGYVLTP